MSDSSCTSRSTHTCNPFHLQEDLVIYRWDCKLCMMVISLVILYRREYASCGIQFIPLYNKLITSTHTCTCLYLHMHNNYAERCMRASKVCEMIGFVVIWLYTIKVDMCICKLGRNCYKVVMMQKCEQMYLRELGKDIHSSNARKIIDQQP